jgi:hypothetical protein
LAVVSFPVAGDDFCMYSPSVKACARPQTFMIFASGSFQIPAISDEMTPVSAVRECSWKLEVTYGVKVLTTPLVKAMTKAMSQIMMYAA